jgi:hypothetical protein
LTFWSCGNVSAAAGNEAEMEAAAAIAATVVIVLLVMAFSFSFSDKHYRDNYGLSYLMMPVNIFIIAILVFAIR